MKLIRYQTSSGKIEYAAQQPDNTARVITGDIYGQYEITAEPAQVAKLLAPIVPTAILCIGLNYKHHAAEAGANPPERPVLFVKGNNTLQNPGDPILLPRFMRSDEVDYECELAVVIGKPCKNATPRQRPQLRPRLHLRQRRQRPRLADQAGRRPMVPRQILRHLRPPRPLPRHPRRNPEPE